MKGKWGYVIAFAAGVALSSQVKGLPVVGPVLSKLP